jgi:hypothetical protein
MASFQVYGAERQSNFIPKKIERDIMDASIRKEIETPKNPVLQKMTEALPPVQDNNGLDPLISAAMKTVDFESRRDKNGNLAVYKLPSGDMGGSYEVAGINDKYHPDAFKAISSLPPEKREQAAAEYVVQYTAPFTQKLPDAVRPFAQDLAFNRGMGGATKYIQQGLNNLGIQVKVDGAIGPQTINAIGKVDPKSLMLEASKAQWNDELRMANQNPDRKKFLNGLQNRINNRFALFGSG